jgi:signal transduction histidine kinase
MELTKDYWKILLPTGLVFVLGIAGVIMSRNSGAAMWVEVFLLLAIAALAAYTVVNQSKQSARIDALRQGLLRYKSGDFSTRVEDSRFDEFGEIVRLSNELAANLQKMQSSMAQVERQRQQLFTDLTQTVAKPLAGLRSSLDKVLRHTNGEAGDGREQKLTSILEEIHHLAALVDDLIEVSNIDGRRFRLNLKQVDLQALLHQAHQRFDVALQRKNMKYNAEVQNNLNMRGDPERLGHVFQSLFANAIKYAGENTAIRVSSARQGNILRLFFEDDGAGMSQDVLKKVFRRFERSGEATEVVGAGLGLSVCKYIVNQHRGRMRIDSSPHKGTKVVLEFMTGGGQHSGHRRRRRPSGRRTS